MTLDVSYNTIKDEAGRKAIEQARQITLPANTPVFRQGDTCENYLLVINGSVKVFSRAENGREILLYRVQAGESCTLTTSCLLANNKYPAEGITETEVKALAIPLAAFNQGLQHSSDFRQFVFDGYGKRISDIIKLVEEISFGRLDIRLAKKLLLHVVGDMTIHSTHQNLATELGSAREVISRQLKDFENKGWIELQRGSIIIKNSQALEDLSRTPLM
jgi:CRP/FNR family transcriptional regulator